jgi:hypothetical protein
VEVGKDHEHIHNTGSRFKLFILQKDWMSELWQHGFV